jgi:hypothetical protein
LRELDRLFNVNKKRKLIKIATVCAAIYGGISFIYSLIKSSEINTSAIILTVCTLSLLSFSNSSSTLDKEE